MTWDEKNKMAGHSIGSASIMGQIRSLMVGFISLTFSRR
jgi:hypothetical protein